jgi:diguanylate cyclase (GGDEF)-like protein
VEPTQLGAPELAAGIIVEAPAPEVRAQRGRLRRVLDAGRWRSQGRVATHPAARVGASVAEFDFQRWMLLLRLLGFVGIAGLGPLYGRSEPVALASAFLLLGSLILVQVFWMRGARSPAAWQRFAVAAFAVDSAASYLVGQSLIVTPDWIGFFIYPMLAIEGAVFFGMSGALASAAASGFVFIGQVEMRASLGYQTSPQVQVMVFVLLFMSALFVGAFAQVGRRVRGDLATLIEFTGVLSRQESPTRIVQALDARLRELLGARVRSVALRRPDGGYDILRWRSSETRTIEPGAVSGVSRFTGRDIEADFRDRRAVTFKITPGRDDGIIVGLGLPAWVRSITMVPIHSDGGLSGFLPVLWESPRVPSIDELELLHGLADQTGLAFAQAQLQRARELAATDTLTDLVNHRSFQDLLRRQIRDAEAHAGKFAILFCDLDRFQELNDKHGHAVGDLVLHRVAGVLKAGARGRDVVARYGGDEIALILPDLDRVQAAEVAERLRAAVRSAEGGMGVDLTIGIAAYPDDATEQAELLARVHAATYAGKRRGRGTIVQAIEVAAEP